MSTIGPPLDHDAAEVARVDLATARLSDRTWEIVLPGEDWTGHTPHASVREHGDATGAVQLDLSASLALQTSTFGALRDGWGVPVPPTAQASDPVPVTVITVGYAAPPDLAGDVFGADAAVAGGVRRLAWDLQLRADDAPHTRTVRAAGAFTLLPRITEA